MSEEISEGLERIWASEKQYVRRMLIGLTRDIDLADDLLQETYLKARDGISSYRGDNDRAWLSTIARNAFLTHIRHHYVSSEINGIDTENASGYSPVGCPDHLQLIQIRLAISKLDPNLRTALLLKHYCEYTYREIAEYTHCAIGTAKWRVSMAVSKLKESLGVVEEPMEMTCADIGRIRILDYLYGSLTPDDKKAVKLHLQGCTKCQAILEDTGKILSALDVLESDLKLMQIIELDKDGVLTLYTMARTVNTSDKPMENLSFVTGKGGKIEYLAAQGEELKFTVRDDHDLDNYPNTYLYTAKLSRPVAPGEAFDDMAIYPSSRTNAVKRDSDGSWSFSWSQLTSVENESVLVLVVRLPLGTGMISTDPPVTEKRVCASTTTLLWRNLCAPNQRFHCDVKYRLSDDDMIYNGPYVGDFIINEIYDDIKSVVHEVPQDKDKADTIEYIQQMHDRFFSKLPLINAANLDEIALKEELKSSFTLYTTIGSRLFIAVTQPLNINIDGDTLNWNGISVPVNDLRLILVGRNPYGKGYCVVYAAGSNNILKGINGCFHGPCSYHIFQVDKLLKEGYYSDKFVLSADRKDK